MKEGISIRYVLRCCCSPPRYASPFSSLEFFVISKGDYMAHFLPNVGASPRDRLPGCSRRRRERGGSIKGRGLRRARIGFQSPDDGWIDEFVKHIKVRGREGGSR